MGAVIDPQQLGDLRLLPRPGDTDLIELHDRLGLLVYRYPHGEAAMSWGQVQDLRPLEDPSLDAALQGGHPAEVVNSRRYDQPVLLCAHRRNWAT